MQTEALASVCFCTGSAVSQNTRRAGVIATVERVQND